MFKVEPGENSYRKTKLISFLVQFNTALLECFNRRIFLAYPQHSFYSKALVVLRCFYVNTLFFLAIVASKEIKRKLR